MIWLKLPVRIIAAAASMVAASATVGVPPRLTAATVPGIQPSRASANSTRGAVSELMLVRLSTVSVEMIVTSSMPPRGSTSCAAAAAGSAEAARVGIGSTRRSAALMSRYSATTSSAPPMIDRGNVRAASVFSSAM